MRTERIRFLFASWAAYVAFYFCPKNLSVILPLFQRDHLYTTYQSAQLVLVFSIAYCIGQFVMGSLADRLGGRFVVLAGMVSASVTATMGFSHHSGSKHFDATGYPDWLYRYDSRPDMDYGLWKDR